MFDMKINKFKKVNLHNATSHSWYYNIFFFCFVYILDKEIDLDNVSNL